MTDITELAQSLKAAAEGATPGEWCSDDQYDIVADAGLNGNYYIASCSGPEHRSNKRFIALANPANVLALVEALEKAQSGEKQWREVVDAFCTDDADWHNLTNSNNELIALLSQALCKQADRISELESRTVKLPPKIERDDADGWFMYNGGRLGGGAADWYNKALDDVGAELAAAGIREAE